MKTVTALSGQTIFDIAVQELGGIDAVFSMMDSNTGLQLDLSIPSGTVVNVPDAMVNRRIAEYYQANDLHPVSGIGEESTITQDDMNNITQDLNYDISAGGSVFERVRLFFLRDLLSVQISYSDISTSTVVVSVEQSLDGENWSQVPYCSFILDPATDTHTFNILGILTNFVRARVEVPYPSTGTIDKIIWKT